MAKSNIKLYFDTEYLPSIASQVSPNATREAINAARLVKPIAFTELGAAVIDANTGKLIESWATSIQPNAAAYSDTGALSDSQKAILALDANGKRIVNDKLFKQVYWEGAYGTIFGDKEKPKSPTQVDEAVNLYLEKLYKQGVPLAQAMELVKQMYAKYPNAQIIGMTPGLPSGPDPNNPVNSAWDAYFLSQAVGKNVPIINAGDIIPTEAKIPNLKHPNYPYFAQWRLAKEYLSHIGHAAIETHSAGLDAKQLAGLDYAIQKAYPYIRNESDRREIRRLVRSFLPEFITESAKYYDINTIVASGAQSINKPSSAPIPAPVTAQEKYGVTDAFADFMNQFVKSKQLSLRQPNSTSLYANGQVPSKIVSNILSNQLGILSNFSNKFKGYVATDAFEGRSWGQGFTLVKDLKTGKMLPFYQDLMQSLVQPIFGADIFGRLNVPTYKDLINFLGSSTVRDMQQIAQKILDTSRSKDNRFKPLPGDDFNNGRIIGLTLSTLLNRDYGIVPEAATTDDTNRDLINKNIAKVLSQLDPGISFKSINDFNISTKALSAFTNIQKLRTFHANAADLNKLRYYQGADEYNIAMQLISDEIVKHPGMSHFDKDFWLSTHGADSSISNILGGTADNIFRYYTEVFANAAGDHDTFGEWYILQNPPAPSNPAPSNPAPSNPVPSNPVPSNPVPSNPAPPAPPAPTAPPAPPAPPTPPAPPAPSNPASGGGGSGSGGGKGKGSKPKPQSNSSRTNIDELKELMLFMKGNRSGDPWRRSDNIAALYINEQIKKWELAKVKGDVDDIAGFENWAKEFEVTGPVPINEDGSFNLDDPDSNVALHKAKHYLKSEDAARKRAEALTKRKSAKKSKWDRLPTSKKLDLMKLRDKYGVDFDKIKSSDAYFDFVKNAEIDEQNRNKAEQKLISDEIKAQQKEDQLRSDVFSHDILGIGRVLRIDPYDLQRTIGLAAGFGLLDEETNRIVGENRNFEGVGDVINIMNYFPSLAKKINRGGKKGWSKDISGGSGSSSIDVSGAKEVATEISKEATVQATEDETAEAAESAGKGTAKEAEGAAKGAGDAAEAAGDLAGTASKGLSIMGIASVVSSVLSVAGVVSKVASLAFKVGKFVYEHVPEPDIIRTQVAASKGGMSVGQAFGMRAMGDEVSQTAQGLRNRLAGGYVGKFDPTLYRLGISPYGKGGEFKSSKELFTEVGTALRRLPEAMRLAYANELGIDNKSYAMMMNPQYAYRLQNIGVGGGMYSNIVSNNEQNESAWGAMWDTFKQTTGQRYGGAARTSIQGLGGAFLDLGNLLGDTFSGSLFTGDSRWFQGGKLGAENAMAGGTFFQNPVLKWLETKSRSGMGFARGAMTSQFSGLDLLSRGMTDAMLSIVPTSLIKRDLGIELDSGSIRNGTAMKQMARGWNHVYNRGRSLFGLEAEDPTGFYEKMLDIWDNSIDWFLGQSAGTQIGENSFNPRGGQVDNSITVNIQGNATEDSIDAFKRLVQDNANLRSGYGGAQ